TATATPIPTATRTSTPAPAGSAYRSAVLADSPLAYWRLGETTGSVAADQRAAYNGTYTKTPSLGQPGALFNDPATSVGFNGTSQYVQVPYTATLNTPKFAFDIWARPSGGAGKYRGVIASRA